MHQADGRSSRGCRANRTRRPQAGDLSGQLRHRPAATSSSVRTPGTKFDAAVHKSYVAFEVDWVEPTWQIGWSVVVRGQARVVTEPEELERVRRVPLLPWAEGDKENFVSIDAALISGRRLVE